MTSMHWPMIISPLLERNLVRLLASLRLAYGSTLRFSLSATCYVLSCQIEQYVALSIVLFLAYLMRAVASVSHMTHGRFAI